MIHSTETLALVITGIISTGTAGSAKNLANNIIVRSGALPHKTRRSTRTLSPRRIQYQWKPANGFYIADYFVAMMIFTL
ncbi:uncharacterized protein F4807DRAFT_51474 [Annulohypoxylon truncatum]|uniref:uncharacterized protein n=1 Tax=Annulohypoxylon truncatum TaxID=327061 RepID=UPI002007A21C|nr:uncharacterized protein F4807DRAFT_51474 [Annulohypoxylon truncatum]KAI1210534.1 hypothetical protein F4807DRAFT_51474 [Annulohypoxylon truncatum]